MAGIDPETAQTVLLFNPRKDNWVDHFAVRIGTLLPLGIEIQGSIAVGRSTARVLGMNEEMRQMLRHEFWLEGRYGGAP